ncbi:diacylglycerol/lipid kinase family protein [Lichenicola sp.]|uniref:diacylglycerol/lipid kinase family protein n=1 Tax=Lichenicola sp. TaxID=2804529 RepID=UPI003AFF9634
MLVIYNPTAGRRRVRRLWAVLDVLVAHGVRLEVAETMHAGHAQALAREAARAGVRLVVAAGGDGTIAEVAAGLDGSNTLLGIIPLGTANVLAHELRLPTDSTGIASILTSERTVPLWPGIMQSALGTRLFVQMLGIGFDAHVVHHISRPVKRVLGKGAYVVQTLRELPRYRFGQIRLRVDGEQMQTGSVIIAKGRLYGGPYLLAPDATPTAPGFSVMLFEHAGIASALLAGAALPLNMLGRVPGVTHRRASEVEVLEQDGLPAQADGDPAGTAPLRVTDASGPLRVLIGNTIQWSNGRSGVTVDRVPDTALPALVPGALPGLGEAGIASGTTRTH